MNLAYEDIAPPAVALLYLNSEFVISVFVVEVVPVT